MNPSICCVVPSIRPAQMKSFRAAWGPLFAKHGVTLITVWDGDAPWVSMTEPGGVNDRPVYEGMIREWMESGLICRRTDACRNLGFLLAATMVNQTHCLTLDDDVAPPAGSDPIQEHLDVLSRRVPISWMNTAMDTGHDPVPINVKEVRSAGFEDQLGERMKLRQMPYLRGFPYGIRDEAPVMVSHGVWVNVPDFDGKTQLELGKCLACNGSRFANPSGLKHCQKCRGTGYDGSRLPYSLPYFRGPVPKGCYFPFCGMNVMVRKEALPYLYFAPMGPDSGVGDIRCKRAKTVSDWGCLCIGCEQSRAGLNRFADIWCGILLKRACDDRKWAIYTGASTVVHTRASDPHKNVEQERLGLEWNERFWNAKIDRPFIPDTWLHTTEHGKYWKSYLDKAARFRDLVRELQGVRS